MKCEVYLQCLLVMAAAAMPDSQLARERLLRVSRGKTMDGEVMRSPSMRNPPEAMQVMDEGRDIGMEEREVDLPPSNRGRSQILDERIQQSQEVADTAKSMRVLSRQEDRVNRMDNPAEALEVLAADKEESSPENEELINKRPAFKAGREKTSQDKDKPSDLPEKEDKDSKTDSALSGDKDLFKNQPMTGKENGPASDMKLMGSSNKKEAAIVEKDSTNKTKEVEVNGTHTEGDARPSRGENREIGHEQAFGLDIKNADEGKQIVDQVMRSLINLNTWLKGLVTYWDKVVLNSGVVSDKQIADAKLGILPNPADMGKAVATNNSKGESASGKLENREGKQSTKPSGINEGETKVSENKDQDIKSVKGKNENRLANTKDTNSKPSGEKDAKDMSPNLLGDKDLNFKPSSVKDTEGKPSSGKDTEGKPFSGKQNETTAIGDKLTAPQRSSEKEVDEKHKEKLENDKQDSSKEQEPEKKVTEPESARVRGEMNPDLLMKDMEYFNPDTSYIPDEFLFSPSQ